MRKITLKEKDIAIKWAMGEISQVEVARRLQKTSTGAYVALALALREVIRTRMMER
jgi:hypothetical protein